MQTPYSDTNAGLHYDLQLELDPRSGLVVVSGSAAYRSPQHRLERARFYLHRQFLIQQVVGRRVLGYHFETGKPSEDPFFTDATTLDVYFDPPLRANETTLIQFAYRGLISEWPADSPNRIGADWAELGHWLPWFPVQHDQEFPPFTYTLTIRCPAGYGAAGCGTPTARANAVYYEMMQPTTDIVVACAPGMVTRTFESEASRVYVAAGAGENPAAAQLGEELLWTLERFSGWFGPIRPGAFTLMLAPRALGGSYARRGLVVLARAQEEGFLAQPAATLHQLAFEAARSWWWQAPVDSRENWLNESFAEYAALLALRERYGNERFDQILTQKRERTAGSPALWDFAPATGATKHPAQAERVFRDLGPVILHDFAQQLSQARFLELCRACLWSGVIDTQHLLDLVEELYGPDARGWLETGLRSSR